jgi:peroxiredoxin
MSVEGSRRSWPRWLFVAVIVVLVVVGSSLALFHSLEQEEPGRSKRAVSVPVEPVLNARAPDFTRETVDGEMVSLSGFEGRSVLINFWATWCGPCRIEMPAIQDRYETYQDDGLVVLAVNFDESREAVQDFRDELGLKFPMVLDPGGDVQRLYRNRSYPVSFFVDEQGIIRAHHIGVMTEGQLDENLAKIGFGQNSEN